MDPRLDNYDWEEAFAYAGEQDEMYSQWGSIDVRGVLPTKEYNTAGFSREDVEYIAGIDEGYNDGPDWIVYGRLKDGRWFFLSAGCDYTGWDCQAGGFAKIADTREEMEQFGLTDGVKARFRGEDIETNYWWDD